MAELVVTGRSGLDYEFAGLWSFIKYLDGDTASPSEGDFDPPGGDDATFYGFDLKVKQAGAGYSAFAGGRVTGLATDFEDTNLRFDIAGINVSAVEIQNIFKSGGKNLNSKLMSLFLSGDDVVTLSVSADRIATFSGDDVIYGRSDDDIVDAGSGDDVLVGGLGLDQLKGGAGSDVFVFDIKGGASNIDTIMDFDVKHDFISISHLTYRGLGHAGELSDKAFWSSTTGKAHDKDDRIIYNTKTGVLTYDSGGTGSAKAIAFADLAPKLKMTADHFDTI